MNRPKSKVPYRTYKGLHAIDKPGVYLTKFDEQVGLWPTFNKSHGLMWTPVNNHHIFVVPAFYGADGQFWLLDYRNVYDITDYVGPLPIDVMRRMQDTFMLAMRDTLKLTEDSKQ